jgi:hypothetical protein
VSEYEELIERVFVERAHLCGDTYVANFVKEMVARRFRSPDMGKITEMLGRFGANYRQDFSTRILTTEYHAAWDNIMQARHAVVHKSGSLNITFRELLQTYAKTKVVLAELRSILGLP